MQILTLNPYIDMKVNRKFKDSVFTKLFNDPDLLRELYCALRGCSLPSDIPVSINTLEKVLYMDLYNDISFEIGGKLVVLIEHQSTVNPNMALRMFFYISKILEKMIKKKGMYTEKPILIPRPEFYVLYNGRKSYPDSSILKLSDLFWKPPESDSDEKPDPLMELEVKVLNINEGKNKDIVKRCKKLSDYSVFITKTYEYYDEHKEVEKSIEEAIKYCRKHDILREFLEIHGSEVVSMILEEWNIDEAMEVWREEAWEDGLAEGLEKGIKQEREEIYKLLEQGCSIETIKQRLTQ